MASIQLLTAAIATNSAPSAATDGVTLGDVAHQDDVGLLVASTAGSGTMTCTIRMWGYSAVTSAWHPLGTGTDSLKGTINEQTALGETGTNVIRHAEILGGLFAFERMYAEIVAIGGTSTAISVWLVTRR